MDIGAILLIGFGIVVALFLLDVLFTRGTMTMGMMAGMGGMMSNPVGQAILLVLLAILGLLVYAAFFR